MDTRNRVWCSIGVLDVRCCLDRGTKPLLRSSAFPCMPLNIDDEEISSATVHIEGHPDSHYTSMSYCRMNYHALACQLKIMELGTSTLIDKRSESIALAWKRQLVALEQFEQFHSNFVQLCLQDRTPIRRLAIAVSTESLVSMRLLLRRPFYKQARDLQTMSEDTFDVLATATEVLESSSHKAQSNDFAQWSWFTWPKWFALAIVLAELCGPIEGQMIDRAWPAAKECYGRYMHQVADTPSGLLWRPIAKLMKRASLVRGRAESAATDGAPPPQQQQQVPMPSPYAGPGPSDSYMTGTQKPLPLPEIDFGSAPMDLNFGNMEAMSWFNWELFVDDLNSQDFSMSLDDTYLG
nr:bikaverin cluster transcription factor bik5 [Quercus suber]